MIYYTSCNDIQDLNNLYKEWVGKDLSHSHILWNSFFVVAKDNDKIIGAAQLIVIDDPFWDKRWGLIENVFVKKEYRRQGIGMVLMKQSENQAIAIGCSFVKLTTRKKEGKELYRSIGYEEGSSFRKGLQ